jgi:AcrR family transcriptional regulator
MTTARTVSNVRVAKKRAYHHGDLRGALVNATFLVAVREGIDGVSLRAVARRAGVSEAAPYHHFKDKRELLAAAAGVAFERLEVRVVEAVERRRDPTAKIVAFAKAYVTFAVEEPGMFRLIFGAHVAEQDLAAIPEAAIPGRRLKARIRELARDEGMFEMLWASSLGWALLIVEKELHPLGASAPNVREAIEKAGDAARRIASYPTAARSPSSPSPTTRP